MERNKPATMISLVSFTKEKIQAMRNKMVQAAIARKLPQSTGGRIVLFNWGLPTCDRNRPCALETDDTSTKRGNLILCNNFEGHGTFKKCIGWNDE